ncbi:MAG: endonuclease [Clostridia bacterium]|nr:endonuclease [Deltaproteobacteria bacterium]
MNAPLTGFAAFIRQSTLGDALVPKPPRDNDPFRGLSDQNLLRAYRKLAERMRVPIDYSTARKLIFTAIDNIGGQVECAYTGRIYKSMGVPDADDINIEHVWPQSKGAKGLAKSDLHHLFPTDNETNSKRGNLPFGVVTKARWSKGGSILGKDKDGQDCFMPREEVRGNVARAMFHFATVYGFRIEAKEEAILRAWAKADPVDATELDRMDRIVGVQRSSNHYVRTPELLDRVDTFDRVPNAPGRVIGFAPRRS